MRIKMGFVAIALASACLAQDGNLLRNGTFEEGKGRAPEAWTKGPRVNGIAQLWAKGVAAGGERSLRLRRSARRYWPKTGWSQTFAHDGSGGKLRIVASVKADRAYKGVVDVLYGNQHTWAIYIGAHADGDPPADHDWARYESVVEIPRGHRSITVDLQMWGPGSLWFDDVRAEWAEDDAQVTDAAGVRPVPLAGSDEPPEPERAPETPKTVTVEDLLVDGDRDKRYFLMTPEGDAPEPGRPVLVVLPGGDGSADFRAFVETIARRHTPADFAIVQPVAPVWRSGDDRVVWPTRGLPDPDMAFSTEELVAAILADVRARMDVDDDRVYIMGWSSGGPPSYRVAMLPDSPFAGAFVAMSVFKPEHLPRRPKLGGRRFYILHSPDDFIRMSFPQRARRELARAGAEVTLETYAGGHGWQGDSVGRIGEAVEWLDTRPDRP